MTRKVVCGKVVNHSFQLQSDAHCRHKPRPKSSTPCRSKTCGPQWYVTEWSKVSFFFLIQLVNRFNRQAVNTFLGQIASVRADIKNFCWLDTGEIWVMDQADRLSKHFVSFLDISRTTTAISSLFLGNTIIKPAVGSYVGGSEERHQLVE